MTDTNDASYSCCSSWRLSSRKVLLPHLRQYRHADGKSFVVGYDRAGVEQVFKVLHNMAYVDGWNNAIAQMAGLIDKMEGNNG